MDTDKVTITISGLQDRAVAIASVTGMKSTPRQVDLFQAGEGTATASNVSAAASPTLSTTVPPEAAKPSPGQNAPWELSTAPGKGLNFQPDTLLHAKMNWVCDNVPKMSRLRILRDGAMAECDRLIALHYKG